MTSVIPYETVDLEKGYYCGVYFIKYFMEADGVDMREEHVDMEPDPDEEEMKDMRLNDKRERHWSMVFKDNGGGVDD